MVLKELIVQQFLHLGGCGDSTLLTTLGGCGGLERTDFNSSTLGGCGGLERTDFNSFYIWRVWWS